MKEFKNVDTIIFDAGGVLFFINEYRNTIIERVLLSMGYDEDKVKKAVDIGNEFDTYYFGRGNSIRTWNDEKKWLQLRSDVISKAVDDGNEELMDRLSYLAFDTFQYKLFDETVEVLERLKERYTLSVLSNATASLDWAFDYLDIRKYFDHVVISAYEACEKPEKKIYEIALERLNKSPEKCVFIDDKIINVEKAESLGIQGYHMNRSTGETLYDFEKIL